MGMPKGSLPPLPRDHEDGLAGVAKAEAKAAEEAYWEKRRAEWCASSGATPA